MKQMIYGYERKHELLLKGKYQGYEFYIMSLGTHPCAYVKLPENHPYYNMDYEDIPSIGCHGGITYKDEFLQVGPDTLASGMFVGWDYAHCFDYTGTDLDPLFKDLPERDGKKWTTEEIYEEVKKVIENLKKAESLKAAKKASKYIRTADTIFEIVEETDVVYKVKAKGNPYHTYSKSKMQTEIVAESEKMEELFNECIVYWKEFRNHEIISLEKLFNGTEYGIQRRVLFEQGEIEVYGAIWVHKPKEGPILKSVAELKPGKGWELL